MSKWFAQLSLSISLSCAACLLDPPGGADPEPSQDDDDNGDGPLSACARGPSQSLSEACCPDFGVDACGAGLFCAAFDGRDVPTCYANGARGDEETCDADIHCASGGCAAAGLCMSSPYQACTVDVGCHNPLAGSETWLCSSADLVCVLGDRANGASCDEDAVCASGICVFGNCADPVGRSGDCEEDADCAVSLLCTGGICDVGRAGAPCNDDLDCDFGCFNGVCVAQANGESCDTSYDCSEGHDTCEDGVCSWVCSGALFDCLDFLGPAQECRDERCVVAPALGDVCDDDGDCARENNGLVCSLQRCRGTSGHGCDEAWECASGVCEDVPVQQCHYVGTNQYGNFCNSNDDCPSTDNVPQVCGTTTEGKCGA